MNQYSILNFNPRWELIVAQKKLVEHKKDWIKQLSYFDKNDSHKDAIKEAMLQKDKMQSRLHELLSGKSYWQWAETAKRLSALQRRLKNNITMRAKIESDLMAINFDYDIPS